LATNRPRFQAAGQNTQFCNALTPRSIWNGLGTVRCGAILIPEGNFRLVKANARSTKAMSDVKKDGGYFTDRNGMSFQTPDGKPPANDGVKIQISNQNGGHSSGTWSGGQAGKDKG
jgi:hypothetical protein